MFATNITECRENVFRALLKVYALRNLCFDAYNLVKLPGTFNFILVGFIEGQEIRLVHQYYSIDQAVELLTEQVNA